MMPITVDIMRRISDHTPYRVTVHHPALWTRHVALAATYGDAVAEGERGRAMLQAVLSNR